MSIYCEARNFAEKSIDPYSTKVDEEGVFPVEAFAKIKKSDFLTLLIPKEQGGLGLGIQEHVEVCRAFAKSDATTGLCYMMHNVALTVVLSRGSEEMKQRIVKEVVEERKLLALAYSELGTGTHFYISDLKAENDGDKKLLSGVKSMVTSAEQASYYLVLAPSDVEGAIDNWLVPLETPGLKFEQNTWHGLGMRGNASCQMHLNKAAVSVSNRIGEEGAGQEHVFNVVAPFFIAGLAGVYSGLGEHMLEESIAHAKERKYTSGTSLAEIETVQIHLAKMYNLVNSSVCAAKEATRSAAAGEEDALAKILSARIIACEMVIEAGRLGMRVGGGKAYNKAGCMERLLRDAYAGQIMAPSADVLTVWLGKAITGLPLV